MISNKMTKSINGQINKELYSAYLYLAMEAYANHFGLSGFASWFRVQVKEEMSHAAKFMSYLNEQGGRVILQEIAEPPEDFKSALDLFEKTLGHEKQVTASICKLVELAKKENDYATEIFLQWFVSEQVEEEASAAEILQKLEMIGSEGNALFMMDRQLAARQ